MRISTRTALVASALQILFACSHANTVQPTDSGPILTGDGSIFTLPDGAVPNTFCGGNACVGTQECCFSTGQCVAPGDRTACPPPPNAATNGGCTANSQCGPTEYCVPMGSNVSSCTGAGACGDRSNCGFGASEPVCGCDGRTYANEVVACNAGVRIVRWDRFAMPGACGVPTSTGNVGDPRDGGLDASTVVATRIPCVIDEHCPSGQRCCAITNACFDPAHPEMCQQPPPGTNFPCLSNADCDPRWDMCAGGPACDSPGFCTSVSSSPCPGVLEPVCGCDGRTYTNSCEATSSHVRIASDAGCGDP